MSAQPAKFCHEISNTLSCRLVPSVEMEPLSYHYPLWLEMFLEGSLQFRQWQVTQLRWCQQVPQQRIGFSSYHAQKHGHSLPFCNVVCREVEVDALQVRLNRLILLLKLVDSSVGRHCHLCYRSSRPPLSPKCSVLRLRGSPVHKV